MNPFRYDRLPVEAHFVNRTAEVARILSSITGGENLLVHGIRRMGKTSCLLRAAREAADTHNAVCFVVDVSRSPSLADTTQALLLNAVPALNRLDERAANWLVGAVKGLVLKPKVRAAVDAASMGGPDMEIEVGLELRAANAEVHATALVDVLDALDALAKKRKRLVAVILDEFTFLEKIGPKQISWMLRSAMQRHQHVTYILAGSAHQMIERLHGQDGPFYGMFGRLHVGPIPPDELAEWIDGKFRQAGKKPKAGEVGQRCVELGRGRTRDVIQLARRSFDLASGSAANRATVDLAMESLSDDGSTEFHAAWVDLPSRAQAILRAITDGQGKTLFSEATRLRFGLGSTAEVSQVCRRLTRTAKNTDDFRDAILVRIQTEAGLEHRFDNPFFEAWVRRTGTS